MRTFDLSALPQFAFSISGNCVSVDHNVAIFSGDDGGWERGLPITENGQLDVHLNAGERYDSGQALGGILQSPCLTREW